ncbi:MAG: bifunctional phosphopantothenoylcysteine decarboxylase/phosphopantothenate--cysteine ligase CoaBC [Deltaproteobacteria bacterium]|jgi:phosphopantothenoylcysteine decarboxylase/phosphopantothenate--cysteine ligase|nr:bifunctional phosphopantothenoylcysteine decarboxylase/phosphopantothenate--cysteine ligase CoaBC [Deltaproteobacteria bacterium]MBW2536244.1 bifunctional phosphopantothenoylcysteine decarboxylase/phosphopantothenate--cysteine ligase CoaBC [Deltaproteobacteria bacterium]
MASDPGNEGSSTRPTVVLALSGSIAAFKAVEVARHLLKAGVRVVPVMTAAAREFVGPATFSGLCGEPVHGEMFAPDASGEIHISLTAEADVVALVPATADLLASMAAGRAQDVVRAIALCARGPVVVAPAMHPRMWAHPATQRNVATLRADGRVRFVGPVEGEVANGEIGMGRMAEPEEIARAILDALGPQDLHPLRIVVSAGPTVEDLDPARFLSNRSSGKMGFAVAERAAARGAEVILVAGPTALPSPAGVDRRDVRSAAQMRQALQQALAAGPDGVDALVMTAAVADYRPAAPQQAKAKRADLGDRWQLELVANPDLLAEIGAARSGPRPVLVGFALETVGGDELVARGRGKLDGKQVDLVVANSAADAFEGDDNRVVLVSATEARPLEPMSKRAVADHILDWVAERCRS